VDGSLWITLDDNEAHYCRVLGDEAFGLSNFNEDVIRQKNIFNRTKRSRQVRAGFATPITVHYSLLTPPLQRQRNLGGQGFNDDLRALDLPHADRFARLKIAALNHRLHHTTIDFHGAVGA
jgi:hypothetical protein